MTTTLLRQEPHAAVAGEHPARSVAVLADELRTAQARLGERIADLDPDDTACWVAIRPTLARLSRAGRQAARAIAVARGYPPPDHEGCALDEDDTVAPVVWSREIGMMHRLLWRALRDIELAEDADGRVAAALAHGVRSTLTVTAELAAADKTV